IWVGLNPKYKAGEVGHVLDDCQPGIILIDPSAQESEAAQACRDRAGIKTFDVAELEPASSPVPEQGLADPIPVSADDTALIVYTSGTTGAPKGAMISHRALRKTSVIQSQLLSYAAPRVLNNLPINHIGSVGDILTSTIAAGGAVIMQQRFNPAEGFELMARHGATLWGQIPTMFQLALDDDSAHTADLSSLKCILFSGAPASPALIDRLRAICPNVVNAYGMTETVGSVTWAIGCDREVLADTVGAPVDAYPLRIAAEAGEDIAPGEVGEIQVQGDFHFTGYWGNEDATRAAFTPDGWLKTGDLGRLRDDGRVSLAGRLKERFKSGGYNVYPREVEAAILEHPGIAEAVVVPVPDEVFFEVGHAFLIPAEGKDCDLDELGRFLAGRLANYKRPKRIHIAPAFPQLKNGKIDRAALRAQARAMLDTPE
ncbi:MAG: fatty acid--CoA ligase family protein, partial [Hyphomonadaceae bacterium]|nr:fatty acid--CoA ligase family protein [Hyphomonadaceae bacterium]